MCPIHVMLSSESASLEDSTLELSWSPSCKNPPRYIGIYRSDPSVSHVMPEREFSPNFSIGRLVTNYKLANLNISSEWNRKPSTKTDNQGHCLPVYVATYMKRGSEFQSINCLKMQPNWMSKMNNIVDVPLSQLFIPGSHASGCYLIKNETETNSLKKFLATQNFDVWTQLMFGVRYLEFSVIYFNNSEILGNKDGFWIVNNGAVFIPLSKALEDIRTFAKQSIDIIIVEFNGFGLGM